MSPRLPAAAIDSADPSAMRFAAPSASVPAEIVVSPVYVFAPPSVSVPVPTLVSLPAPPITPPNVVLVLFWPTESVPLVTVTLPAPASEPIVSLAVPRLKVAPAATDTAD